MRALLVALALLVNHQRAQHGEQPVRLNRTLEQAAAGCPEHGMLDCARRLGFSAQAVGVDTAWGQRSPRAAVRAWMLSPPHRAILLDGRYTSIGTAVRRDWWRIVLAAPAAHGACTFRLVAWYKSGSRIRSKRFLLGPGSKPAPLSQFHPRAEKEPHDGEGTRATWSAH